MGETFHSKWFREQFPTEIRESATVTMSYQQYLIQINHLLKEIYGEAADWKNCLNQYFNSAEYQQNCHVVNNCDDIPELTKDDIVKMIKEEADFEMQVSKFADNHHFETNVQYNDLFEKFKLLGLTTENIPFSFHNWLIDKSLASKILKNNSLKNNKKYNSSMNLIETLFATLFQDGMLLEFPVIGSVMTQKKSKYYYRGENAFYGSSKPSAYRNTKKRDNIDEIIKILRIIECAFLLDKFDAVKHWDFSSVNYIALAQHYGLHTPMIDITSDLKTALFFLCCKYGEDKKWHPLTNAEIKQQASRKHVADLGGDSRYGILYRSLTEITDMQWAISDNETCYNIITPVGFQPFMRCSQQHAYMLWVQERNYDMLKDPSFDKFKIRLDEDLCSWIYKEMDEGISIYPNNDIPDISPYIEKINTFNIFSESVFLSLFKDQLDNKKIDLIKKKLEQKGIIIRNDICHIQDEHLQKINKQYNAETARQIIKTPHKMRPIMILPSDMFVETI